MFRRALLSLAVFFALAQTALAHPGHGGHDLSDGLQHPLHGVDHLAAMVAVGLLAVRIGGRALWIMPCAFMGSMLVGGLSAAIAVPLPGIEYGIALSVLVLGLLIAATRIVPLAWGAAIVAFFAVFHGHAHAAEMTAGGSLAAYAAGFILATALLHIAGVLGGLVLVRPVHGISLRLAGATISVLGVWLLWSVPGT